MRFENGGHPVEPLKVIGDCEQERTGTSVTFKPDGEIFDSEIYDYDTLKVRVRELAFLNKGLSINLRDDRDDEDTTGETFMYEGGISEYVKYINQGKTPVHEDIIHLTGEEDNVVFEVALQYNTGYNENIYSFVNNINTHDGGTHEEGVRRALTRVINNYARKNNLLKEKDEPLSGDDVKEGLTMIISCKHPNPQFEGQTKGRLGNSEVRRLADNVFAEGFERFLLENPDDARAIISKAILACHARNAAKRAREITRKSDLATTNFFGKLSDCKSKDPKVSEIFIVEGDSAGGSAKKGRDSITQAILPLRGKILNVEKARLDRALSNEEIRTIITAFGTGVGQDEFDINKLRYDKIIIMTDADVDGSHIRVLLLTLFYRFFRPIVEAGHVYAAQPPLFRIMHGKTRKYVLNEEELEKYLSSLPDNIRSRAEIARMKGLGEMDAEELNETTMDINKRVLRKITVDDCVAADAIFEKLMGDEVEPRRKFIEENAGYVQNLDI
jgi:DNA gyrase subunit B